MDTRLKALAVDSGKGVRERNPLSAVSCVVAVIVMVVATTFWALLNSGTATPALANSETTIQATVLSIDVADARSPIDASEDILESGRCWLVKVAVKGRVPGLDFAPDQSLNLLVHSPSATLGVSGKGEVCTVRLRPTSTPAEFLGGPGRFGAAAEVPDTTHRRFSILTIP
jgi:hypothetical protein